MATKYNLNKFNLYNNLILNKMQITNKIEPQNLLIIDLIDCLVFISFLFVVYSEHLRL